MLLILVIVLNCNTLTVSKEQQSLFEYIVALCMTLGTSLPTPYLKY